MPAEQLFGMEPDPDGEDPEFSEEDRPEDYFFEEDYSGEDLSGGFEGDEDENSGEDDYPDDDEDPEEDDYLADDEDPEGDDYLTDDALEKVVAWDAELPDKEHYCGFVGNRGTTSTETPNRLFEGGYLDGTALDRYTMVAENDVLVNGERAFVFYTDVHRKYMYPEFPGEKFLTEAVTWDLMAYEGYKMRFYNDIIWVWEYKPDGLTKAGYKVFLDNPQGTGLFFRQKAKFLNYSLKQKLLLWYGYATDAMDRCTDRQIAEYIDMPLWLVPPVRWLHALVQIIRKKR
jgi:hypothetical protein